jgi:hypothetical protein
VRNTGCVWGGIGLVVAVGLAGCPYSYDDDDSAAGGIAPIIDTSFPSAAVQTLNPGESIEFSARGEDPDSIELDWQFTLGGGFEAGGEANSGTFDVSWTLEHRAELAGANVDVEFLVSDGVQSTSRLWAIDVSQ